eukprot:CAMPEP_0170518694 /NCGR_PEP_ID=MMETSP0209-20121228/4323_1 /TAXON_ID=665100 ORGANISM="Litonotus pictus, Strain P1" /NCGR_SAMPLE_ID=MMETSP0209 /ASSEMBLY_ACC=CAM_ASM_000301 /LENGTH=167 /DNA_ID=CAMNT_0010804341 /DNA_START=420 /DNA_END=922 /DNA_ORIENTATION=-
MTVLFPAKDFDLENGLIDYILDTSVLRIYNQDLTLSDKVNHLDSVFYNEAMGNWFKKYSQIMDRLRLYFNIRNSTTPVNIYLFDYPDKSEEVNHKVFFDLRKALYLNYQEIYKEAVFLGIVKFNNEFKGYYITDVKMKSLEGVNKHNKDDSQYKQSTKEEFLELNFL